MKNLKPHYIIISALFFLSACDCPDDLGFDDGPLIEEELEFEDEITGIELDIQAEVILQQGDEQKVMIEARQDIIDEIETDVNNGTWRIGFDWFDWFHHDIRIYVTLPSIEYIKQDSRGEIRTDGIFTQEQDLEVEIKSSGDVELEVYLKKLITQIEGRGDIILSGEVEQNEISMKGSGVLRAFGCKASETEIKLEGSGDAYLSVQNSLTGSLSGSGDIYYRGAPEVDIIVTGTGEVIEVK